MAQHGWGGRPPATELEARQRIVDATAACIDRVGIQKTTLSDVAAELGVIRQTVYRYFPKLSDIVAEVAAQGAETFVDQMVEHLQGSASPAEAVVEGILFSVRTIPTEPRLSLLLQISDEGAFGRGATSALAVQYGAEMLHRFPVDWSEAGLGEDDLEGLAELIMRLLTSLLENPTQPARSDDELRGWLRKWIAPALAVRPPIS
ncbi:MULTISPECIES: TetR/AcrR family transcriptional regulator [unclassified Nocardioides]|uniref:TetR/AcrR family transcriptional regulator n=1 Tax=unclassified Nocardioides TaxID=2615069 RepID=UPI0006FF4B0F|nr:MULTISPECIES: TetR/AcrR family transcriptional regulator [unclassified Nocardioides]KRA32475.1 TetR family transcriptional regulator [Nocardioides sp. Root614]KRA89129.1 TetR family transcriptional regulator [Nocardioides sp. Root682]